MNAGDDIAKNTCAVNVSTELEGWIGFRLS
jgi:hypothetical protein